MEKNQNKINLQIITLVAYYDMICKEKAIEEVKYSNNESEWAQNITRRAWNIMDSSTVHVRQNVNIQEDTIIVVLDTNEITTETVEEAILLVKAVIDANKDYFEFGPIRSYRSYEVVNILEGSKHRSCLTQMSRTLYSNFEILQ